MIKRRRKIIVSKNCPFCKGELELDYKKIEILEKYLTERGKILAKSKTGLCSKHQKRLARAVKKARYLALLPYTPSFR